MKYVDMHCDTLTELYLGGYSINDAPLHISLKNAKPFTPYIQVAAVWTDKSLSDDEAYERFFRVTDHIKQDPSVRSGEAQICHTKSKLDFAVNSGIPTFIFAVEGARILAGDITRLRRLYDEGVRLITLQWSDSDCIGGAWNTNEGLTDFGRQVLCEMARLGIAADISHASDKTASEILDIADECDLRVCASHSNSRSICSHRRNLTDELFRRVKEHDGIVGISMAPEHLSDSGTADISDIRRHIYNYLSIDGENTVCLGCDFDGISTTPAEICGITDVTKLWSTLENDGISEDILTKLFFGNAHRFIRGILD